MTTALVFDATDHNFRGFRGQRLLSGLRQQRQHMYPDRRTAANTYDLTSNTP